MCPVFPLLASYVTRGRFSFQCFVVGSVAYIPFGENFHHPLGSIGGYGYRRVYHRKGSSVRLAFILFWRDCLYTRV